MSQDNLYDTVLYRGFPYPQTHPARLATLAFLYGLDAVPIDACRVLELGCGDGANLLPMAVDLDTSEFVGIDLAAAPIASGLKIIAELKLKNISLRQQDLSEVSAELGRFDYIIAHGVYSWVTQPVRDKVLAICKQNLAPRGVAFVSYNTYPGGHLRQMIRQMMLFHAGRLREPQERIEQARALLDFLTKFAPDGALYSTIIKQESEFTLGRADEAIFHDDLAEVNAPVYFHQFVEHAAAHGLQYLSETFLSEAATGIHSSAAEFFTQSGLGQLAQEQYLDFLNGRKFRQTLLCHQNIALEPAPVPARLRELLIASSAAPVSQSPDIATAGAVEQFRVANGGVISIDLPIAKAALVRLGEIWPTAEVFDDLVLHALTMLRHRQSQYICAPKETEQFCQFILATYGSDMIELSRYRPRFLSVPSERPKVSPLVRLRARRGGDVTSQRHVMINVGDGLARQLLIGMDGTKDRQQLVDHLIHGYNGKSFDSTALFDERKPPTLAISVAELNEKLAELARLALLVG